jgi:hypothetical protein
MKNNPSCKRSSDPGQKNASASSDLNTKKIDIFSRTKFFDLEDEKIHSGFFERDPVEKSETDLFHEQRPGPSIPPPLTAGKKKNGIPHPGALPRENETWDENLSHFCPGLCGGRSKPDPVEKSNGTGSFDTMQSYSGS